VSSPPIVTSDFTSSFRRTSSTLCMLVSDFAGFVRAVRGWNHLAGECRDVVNRQLRVMFRLALREPLEPVAKADDLKTLVDASMVAAAMTPLIPGAGPPPTNMPILPRFIARENLWKVVAKSAPILAKVRLPLTVLPSTR